MASTQRCKWVSIDVEAHMQICVHLCIMCSIVCCFKMNEARHSLWSKSNKCVQFLVKISKISRVFFFSTRNTSQCCYLGHISWNGQGKVFLWRQYHQCLQLLIKVTLVFKWVHNLILFIWVGCFRLAEFSAIYHSTETFDWFELFYTQSWSREELAIPWNGIEVILLCCSPVQSLPCKSSHFLVDRIRIET